MSFERCKHANLVSEVLPCRECDLEVENSRLHSELEHSQRCRNNQEVQGVKNRERIRELEAEVAKLREGNETWRQIAKAREAQVYRTEKELESLRRVNHRRLCGCEESPGCFGCALACPCVCHSLRAELSRLDSEYYYAVSKLQKEADVFWEERNRTRIWAKAWKWAAHYYRNGYKGHRLARSALKDALDVIEQWENWRQYTSAPMNGVSPSLVEKTIAKIKKALG